MNKSDIKLIIIILLIAIISLFVIAIINNNSSKKALVYYDNNLVLTIDLNNNEENVYFVDGYNGIVKIITKDGKIKVDEENSPLHLCSKQGFIENTYENIVCLPNKVIIKITSSKKNDLDAIVG